MTGTIEEILRRWKERLGQIGIENPGLAVFIASAIRATDEQDLAAYDIDTLQTLLTRTFSHLGERKPGRADIRVWTPDQGVAAGVTVIDIYSADTPFIVDSRTGRHTGGGRRRPSL